MNHGQRHTPKFGCCRQSFALAIANTLVDGCDLGIIDSRWDLEKEHGRGCVLNDSLAPNAKKSKIKTYSLATFGKIKLKLVCASLKRSRSGASIFAVRLHYEEL